MQEVSSARKLDRVEERTELKKYADSCRPERNSFQPHSNSVEVSKVKPVRFSDSERHLKSTCEPRNDRMQSKVKETQRGLQSDIVAKKTICSNEKGVSKSLKPSNFEGYNFKNDKFKESLEKGKPIQNKIDGLQREADVRSNLEKQYPHNRGYDVISESYLRDANGNIVKDTETGQARRIDFVVIKDGRVIDSIEVTSETADKTEQIGKEKRIRKSGGNYIKGYNGRLIRIPDNVITRIERRK